MRFSRFALGLLVCAPGVAFGQAPVPGPSAAALAAGGIMDDPTGTIYGLGPSAVSNGTINIEKISGLALGAGQTTAARQSNATLLQTAFNFANTAGLTLACPLAATIEINNTTGLKVTSTNGIYTAVFNQACNIIQFGTNTPILTFGDPAGGGYNYNILWSGGKFDYGVSQTGNTSSVAVLLGALAYSNISNIRICDTSDANGHSLFPPYTALQVGNTNYSSTSAQFFSNTIEHFNLGGAQSTLFGLYIGGTGNVFTDFYSHNGKSYTTANALTGPAAWNIVPGGGTIVSDDVFTRINVEHFAAASAFQIQGAYNMTFNGLHIEDPQMNTFANSYGASLMALTNAQVTFNNTFLLDLHTVSGLGGIQTIFNYNYASVVDANGFKLKWASTSGQLNTSGLFFAAGNMGRANSDDASRFTVENIQIEDDSGSFSESARMSLEPSITTPFSILQKVGQYRYDPLLPITDRAEFTVPGAAFTLQCQHEHATVYAPASLAAAQTITLADLKKASGTGSTAACANGSFATVHRISGTFANATTVKDGAGATLSTISTSTGQDLGYAFGTSAWANVP